MSSNDKEELKHTALNTESRFLKEVKESHEKKESEDIWLKYKEQKNVIQDEMGQFPGHKGNSFELVFDEKYDKPQEINGVIWKSARKVK